MLEPFTWDGSVPAIPKLSAWSYNTEYENLDWEYMLNKLWQNDIPDESVTYDDYWDTMFYTKPESPFGAYSQTVSVEVNKQGRAASFRYDGCNGVLDDHWKGFTPVKMSFDDAVHTATEYIVNITGNSRYSSFVEPEEIPIFEDGKRAPYHRVQFGQKINGLRVDNISSTYAYVLDQGVVSAYISYNEFSPTEELVPETIITFDEAFKTLNHYRALTPDISTSNPLWEYDSIFDVSFEYSHISTYCIPPQIRPYWIFKLNGSRLNDDRWCKALVDASTGELRFDVYGSVFEPVSELKDQFDAYIP